METQERSSREQVVSPCLPTSASHAYIYHFGRSFEIFTKSHSDIDCSISHHSFILNYRPLSFFSCTVARSSRKTISHTQFLIFVPSFGPSTMQVGHRRYAGCYCSRLIRRKSRAAVTSSQTNESGRGQVSGLRLTTAIDSFSCREYIQGNRITSFAASLHVFI